MDPKNKSWDDGDRMVDKGRASAFTKWAPDSPLGCVGVTYFGGFETISAFFT